MGVRVSVQADVAHLGGGDQIQNAVHHPQARPENGNNGQLFARDALELAGGDGGLDLHVLQGQVPGGLVALQRRHLRDDLPKFLHAGVFIPQDTQLMLEQRVVQNVYFFVKHD